jgi:hypothetical protein
MFRGRWERESYSSFLTSKDPNSQNTEVVQNKQTSLGKKKMHSGRFAFTLSVILFITIFPYIQVPTQLRKYMIQMFL